MTTDEQQKTTTTHSTKEGIAPLSVAVVDAIKKKRLYYYHKNKDRYREKRNAKMREYRKANKERIAAYNKQYWARKKAERTIPPLYDQR